MLVEQQNRRIHDLQQEIVNLKCGGWNPSINTMSSASSSSDLPQLREDVRFHIGSASPSSSPQGRGVNIDSYY